MHIFVSEVPMGVVNGTENIFERQKYKIKNINEKKTLKYTS